MTIIVLIQFSFCYGQIDKTIPLAETLEELEKIKNENLEFDESTGNIIIDDTIVFKITDVKDINCITLIEPDENTAYIKFEKKDDMKDSILQINNIKKEKRKKLQAILIHIYRLYMNKEWLEKKKNNKEELF